MAMISIIMPVYNTGVVIHDTIKSILNQTYTDFELLLIDDGSTDGTSAICDEYAIKDSRIKVFHKKNGGICDARNYGLSKVTSKYLAFCDHDDIFDKELLEIALTVAEREKCEVVKYGHKTYNENKRNTQYYIHSQTDVILQNEQLKDNCLKLVESKALVPVWDAIYLTEFLSNNHICFERVFKHGGEDVDFSIRWYKCARKIAIITPILYTHFVRKSLSTSSKLYDDIFYNFIHQLELVNNMIDELHIDVKKFEHSYKDAMISYVIGFISYGTKMDKPYKIIKNGLKNFQDLNLIKNSKTDFCWNKADIKKRLSLFLFENKIYYSLYLMFKFRSL